MKKMFVGLTVMMTMAVAVTTFATSMNHLREGQGYFSVATQLTTQGKGNCRHAGCSCQRYVSAHTGGKCVCGHWDYVHN